MRCSAVTLLSGFALLCSTINGFAQDNNTEAADITAPPSVETSSDEPAATSSEEAVPDTSIKGDVMLELNGAVPGENGGCRLTVVTSNRLDQEITRAAWQVAIFDKEGVVQSLPILDFGAMIAGKTKIAMFELQDRACTDIGRIVVNDVAACEGKDGSDLSAACLSGLTTQSRTDIDFGL